MSAIRMYLRSICLTLSLLLLSTSAHASFFKEAGDWYTKITNPISWLFGVVATEEGNLYRVYIDPDYGMEFDETYPYELLPREEANAMMYGYGPYANDEPVGPPRESELLPYTVDMDYVTAVLHKQDFDDAHNNPLLYWMTFGNGDSMRNLNIVYRMSLYVNQYHLFAYDGDDWVYLPTKLDAASMLMYGVSYVVNIPQRIITRLDAIWDRNAAPSGFRGLFRFVMTIDWIISSLSQVIEFVICYVGTIIGIVVALFYHPLDSLCSLVGMIYFVIPVAWSAVVDTLISLYGLFT